MSTKIGRNDPCHCGSGKKYKRCHLPLDQQRKPAVKAAETEAESPTPTLPQKFTAASLRDLASKVPPKADPKLEALLAQTMEVAEYMEREEEINAAGAALEPHREEFDRLMKNEEAAIARSRALFAEKRFAPLWFTAADIRRAFNHVGGAPDLSLNDEAVETLRESIFFLADKERRTRLAMGLLKHMPDCVKAGRFMDGWLIQHCGYATSELPRESNLFLFEMFMHGYEAWQNEEQERSGTVMQVLGMDPARLCKA
jgi:hypothetical protein